MSPTIRSKGGLPLMVGGQLVAGSQACCCENPPPPRCWCPDYCQYKIEVVSPEEFAVSSRYDCNGSDASRFTEPSIIQSVFDAFDGEIDCPGEVSGGGAVPCGNYSGASMSNAFMGTYGLTARAGSIIRKRSTVGITPAVGGQVYYAVRVYCSLMGAAGEIKPQIFLELDLILSVFNTAASLGELFFYARTARKIVRIDNENCEKAGNRVCLYLNDSDRRIANFQTPLEFTLSIATTSFGDYDEDVLSGREHGPYEDVLDSLSEAGFAATFRITSRPSCKTVGCSCNAFLDGMYVTFGNLLQFPYGASTFDSVVLDSSLSQVYPDRDADDRIYWVGPFGYYEYTQYDPNGPEDNDGRYTRLLWQQKVEIVCDVIDGVQQWVVIFTSLRKIYDEDGIVTHESYDEWVGKIDCYEACEDLDNYIDAGDSVPMGEPYDIEYIGRTTAVARLECEPPPHATISIRQIVTC
jgi:hypothetical protein